MEEGSEEETGGSELVSPPEDGFPPHAARENTMVIATRTENSFFIMVIPFVCFIFLRANVMRQSLVSFPSEADSTF